MFSVFVSLSDFVLRVFPHFPKRVWIFACFISGKLDDLWSSSGRKVSY